MINEIENIQETVKTVEADEMTEKFYNEGIRQISEFYNYKKTEVIPPLILVEKREEFDKIVGRKTEDWVVGITHNNYILLFSRDSYERESKGTHKYTDTKYYQLIKHEISHVIVGDIANNMCPRWLNEGLALYSSEQTKTRKKPDSFNIFLNTYKNNEPVPGLYAEAGFAVEILIKKFGKDMVIDFLKTLDDTDTPEKVINNLEKFFKISLNYEWFNNELRKS